MVWVKPTESVYRVVESFYAANSASEEVFLYYKFGRHQGVFPEKPYFLLSHCAHLLFSLWRIEEENGKDAFTDTVRPTAFLADLDFQSLCYTDYRRRILREDSLEDHWRNETQWFKFWIRVLEHLDAPGATVYREFSRQILTYAAQGDVLQKKATNTNHGALCRFLKTDVVGHVMLRTLSVLDDLMRWIVLYLAGLDPEVYILDQLSLLAGLLSEIRRTIIYRTPAQGPYTPASAVHWREPSRLRRLLHGGTRGILTVIPKREGGDIICTYSPEKSFRGRRQRWMRAASSLEGTYEQELFSTWSYETGEYRETPGQFPDVKACWVLQYEEAGRLEGISRLIDALLDVLRPYPVCEALIEDVRSVSRNGRACWGSTELPWTCVHQLDELLGKLVFIRREAKAMGGYEAAERVIVSLWPPRTAATGPSDSPRGNVLEDGIASGEPACKDDPSVPDDPQGGASEADLCAAATPERLSATSEASIPAMPADGDTVRMRIREEQASENGEIRTAPEILDPPDAADAGVRAEDPARSAIVSAASTGTIQASDETSHPSMQQADSDVCTASVPLQTVESAVKAADEAVTTLDGIQDNYSVSGECSAQPQEPSPQASTTPARAKPAGKTSRSACGRSTSPGKTRKPRPGSRASKAATTDGPTPSRPKKSTRSRKLRQAAGQTADTPTTGTAPRIPDEEATTRTCAGDERPHVLEPVSGNKARTDAIETDLLPGRPKSTRRSPRSGRSGPSRAKKTMPDGRPTDGIPPEQVGSDGATEAAKEPTVARPCTESRGEGNPRIVCSVL